MEPLFLVTNDDGYQAPGLKRLVLTLASIGRVLVVAPERPQSAVSHTITLHKPLRLKRYAEDQYHCSGSPADCVYLGLHTLCGEAPPTVVVSGINHGPNLGTDVFYSGTVAGAMEGCLSEIPALSISQSMAQHLEFNAGRVDYGPAADLARDVVLDILEKGLPKGVMLNLNVPPGYDRARGVAIAKLGRRDYGRDFHRREDPRGRQYYWVGGSTVVNVDIPNSDCNHLTEGYATLTPLRADLTAHSMLDELSKWPTAQTHHGERDENER